MLSALLLACLARLTAAAGCSVVHSGSPSPPAGLGRLLVQGTALTADGPLRQAQILVVNGTIASVTAQNSHFGFIFPDEGHLRNHLPQHGSGLDDVTVIRCTDDCVISPGFINTHEHIEFSTVRPLADIGERVDHRHDWRVGLRGHTVRPAPVNSTAGTVEDAIAWGELRHLLSGTTSIVGGQMVPGLVRNLDFADGLEEPLLTLYRLEGVGSDPTSSDLGGRVATWDVFPLDDAPGIIRVGDCNYGPDMVDGDAVAKMHRYLAHVAEGIDDAALNEFRCLSDRSFDTKPAPPRGNHEAENDKNHNAAANEKHPARVPADIEKLNESRGRSHNGTGHSHRDRRKRRPVSPEPGTSTDILGPNIGLVHALGVPVSEYPGLASRGVSVIWSPRSNVFLYGKTLDIHALLAAGVNVALGTDWLPSGSATMSREAACARDVSRLTARALWEMMTANAAQVAGVGGKLGSIEVGAIADLVIFSSSSSGRGRLSDGNEDDHLRDSFHAAREYQDTEATQQNKGDGGHDDYFARAVFADPADIQLVLRGGEPTLVDSSMRDLVMVKTGTSSSNRFRCEEIPYPEENISTSAAATTTTTTGNGITKLLCTINNNNDDDDDDDEDAEHPDEAAATAANGHDNGEKEGRETIRRRKAGVSYYNELVHHRLARGVYPALFPRGVPDDEPSCVPTR